MLFIFNKEKIYAYIVSFLTVVALFCVTKNVQNETENSTLTSVNIYNENSINTVKKN